MINTNHQGGFTKDRALTEIDGATNPDLSEQLDTTLAFILDACLPHHLPIEAAKRVLLWHLSEVRKAEQLCGSELIHDLVQRMTNHEAVRVEAWGLAFAAGLPFLQGQTMHEIAGQIGCTPAAISKSAVRWTKTLELEPSRYMKSVDARQAYRERQRRLS